MKTPERLQDYRALGYHRRKLRGLQPTPSPREPRELRCSSWSISPPS